MQKICFIFLSSAFNVPCIIIPESFTDNAGSFLQKPTTERPEAHTLDATQQPPDLFTGTFQEEATSVRNPHEETDVYLATPDQKYSDPPVIPSHLKEDSGTASPVGSADTDLEQMPSQRPIAISRTYICIILSIL